MALYFLLPGFFMNLFFGGIYISVAPYLGWFGIFTALYAMASILIYYFLFIGKTKIATSTLIAAVIQSVLIIIFHSSFTQVIAISAGVTLLLFIGLLLYFLIGMRHETIGDRPRLEPADGDS